MTVHFTVPPQLVELPIHHAQAASGNLEVADEALGVLRDVLSGDVDYERLLLRAAAGAGKSYVLKRMVVDVVESPNVARVAITAFTNKQTHPIARDLGQELGKSRVCLFVSAGRVDEIPADVSKNVTVATKLSEIPPEAVVIVSPVQKFGVDSSRKMANQLGAGFNGEAPFDVLFVDEAWQVANYLFDDVKGHAPVWVGVGDVGQLPPLEVGSNPWRGDSKYNPYRAWPTAFESGDKKTWVRELPAVWRPSNGHLQLWRAFYPDWNELHCVAAPGDRAIEFDDMAADVLSVWEQVATGIPTLLEIDGLAEPEAPDVDLPLIQAAKALLDALIKAGVRLRTTHYDDAGSPTGESAVITLSEPSSDPMFAFLATRNQAVDDATEAVEELTLIHNLKAGVMVASTVDSWQGQTNGITVAIHPLSGASELDEFNSAFGRLAVTSTRATHGLLMVTRPGLDDLLGDAPAHPGIPLGEPGFRTLPRQTHERILQSFARGKIDVGAIALVGEG